MCGLITAGESSEASWYFHNRTVRSVPEEAICEGETNLAALMDER